MGAEGVTDKPRTYNAAGERDSQSTWVSRRSQTVISRAAFKSAYRKQTIRDGINRCNVYLILTFVRLLYCLSFILTSGMVHFLSHLTCNLKETRERSSHPDCCAYSPMHCSGEPQESPNAGVGRARAGSQKVSESEPSKLTPLLESQKVPGC
jgi:hypothetical protein